MSPFSRKKVYGGEECTIHFRNALLYTQYGVMSDDAPADTGIKKVIGVRNCSHITQYEFCLQSFLANTP